MSPFGPVGPVGPVSPRGIVKSKTTLVDVPVFVTIALVPGDPVMVVPIDTVGVMPFVPFVPFIPLVPFAPVHTRFLSMIVTGS